MAGTIGQLNFEVIISDKKFDAQIKEVEAKARQFNTSLSNILNIRKISTQMSQKDVENARRVWQAKVDEQRAQEKINREKVKTEGLQRKINAQIDRATKGYNQQSRILNELKGYALGYLSLHGAGQLLASLVRVTGEFEEQKVVLGAMLGDLNMAESIITRIQGLAVESPFQFKELTTYAKQLSAFSVPAQELYDTTKMLADVSAGLGVGMDRIILAYGQVRSAAFLRGQEVRQFTEAGIPILDELAKQFSELEGRAVSTGEVFDKISKRLVPFEMVSKMFKDMTSEGGKFFNMQEVKADTLKGKWSNLKDAYEVMLNEIGSSQSDRIKGAFDWGRKLMRNYEDTGRVLVELVAAYGVYKAALIAAEVATGTFTKANHKIINSFLTIGKAVSSNPYVLLASGIAAVGFAAYKSFTQLEPYEKVRKSIVESEAKYNNALASEEVKLESLYAKLRLATKGTEEYDKAKKEIYSQYAGYISSLREEGVDVTNLVGIYDKLKNKINETVQAKFRNMAVTDLETEFGDQMDKVEKEVDRTLKSVARSIKRELTVGEEVGLRKYILGGEEKILTTPEMQGVNNFLKNIKGFNVVEFTRNQVSQVVDEYRKGREKIEAIWGEEVATEDETVTPFEYPKDEGKGKTPAEKVQEEIDAVKRLRDVYETLAPYMNGDMLRKTLTALFPNADQQLIQSLDFRARLVELAAELNQFDENASKKLLDSIGGERASEIVSAFKAVETYKNMMDSWLGEDFNLTGEGVSFDISKIIRDLNNQYAKINQKAIQANDLLTKAQMGDEAALATVREVYGEEVWQKYVLNGKAAIEELARLEREEAKKTSDEKIRDLSSKYVSEQMSKNNISLSDFADKTSSQIRDLVERMKAMRDEAQSRANNSLVDIVLGNMDEGQYAQWQMMLDVVDQLNIKIADTEEELNKKALETAISATNAIGDLGGEIESLGASIGDSGLADLGKSLSDTANLASGLMEALKAEDTVAIIANVVSFAIKSITDVFTRAIKQEQALYEASLKLRDAMTSERRGVYETMFGTDEMGLAAENLKILNDAYSDYEATVDKFNQKRLQRHKLSSDSVSFENTSVADILGEISDAQGWDLYRESGELNIEAIKSYYEAYADFLTRKQKSVVQELIDSNDFYAEAAAQQAEYLKEVFGGVADDMATSMVDAFLESGDAAIDMGNIISDVSKQMVADLIKSIYLMPVLNDYADKIAAVEANTALSPTEKAEQQLDLLDTALQEIAGQSDEMTETIDRFADYIGGGEEGTTDLGEGIKGITEDQANLLASYLNAIRADMSYSKTLWQKMDVNLQRIADMLTSSPTLMEYQAQIAANTYNTAVATQEILAELRSVVTTDSGDSAIRVFS